MPAIRARNGYRADLHDMVITERGTALLMAYDYVQRNLRRLGGRRNGTVLDNVVQEVDLSTGLVLFEWHSLGQVGLDDSRSRPRGERAWDYFHINSVAEDTDGNLIVGARNTCAPYTLDRHTGRILWQLGGRGGDFRMGKGTRFCFQHDTRRTRPGRISLFDNAAGPPAVRRQSRAIVLDVDERARRARLVHEYHHPGRLLAPSQGAAGVQPNGNMFVGWGAFPVFSEFTRSGRMIFNGQLTKGKGNYRAIRAPWTGRPVRPPAIAAERGRGRRVRIFASWNGATDVARWQVLAGPAPDRLERSTGSPRDGFETTIGVSTRARYVAVEALDAAGERLGTSAAVRPRP